MSASAIIPGRLYLVRASGKKINVIARHPCDAIVIALTAIGPASQP